MTAPTEWEHRSPRFRCPGCGREIRFVYKGRYTLLPKKRKNEHFGAYVASPSGTDSILDSENTHPEGPS